MQTIHPTRIEAVVAARNRINAEINQILPKAITNFTPLIGKKIMKIGGLLEKYKSFTPVATDGIRLSLNQSDYSLSYNISLEEKFKGRRHWTGDGSCGDNLNYLKQEAYFVIADLEYSSIKKMSEHTPWRTDYTVEELLAAKAMIQEAELLLSKGKAKLLPFTLIDIDLR